jgi:hypothetical protein
MKTILLIPILILGLLTGCSKDSTPAGSGEGTPGTTAGTLIDNVSAPNNDISAAIDKNDKLHVCYESFNTDLRYATNKSGTWVKTILFTETAQLSNGGCNDIAVDSSGFVHIVYVTFAMSMNDTSTIMYATNRSGSWTQTRVAFAPNSQVSGAGIAVTPGGKVHIAYGDQASRLRYRNNLSGTWSGALDLGSFWASVRPRLALDATNNVFIAYEHGGERTLRLQVINSSGSPVSNSILDGVPGSGISVGWTPAIAVNRTNGTLLVPYWNYDSQLLRLYDAGSFVRLDSVDWTEPSVVTDNSGKGYISYTNLLTHTLCYATNRSGQWVTVSLPVAATGKASDLVVESTGKVDFVYAEYGANAVRVYTR